MKDALRTAFDVTAKLSLTNIGKKLSSNELNALIVLALAQEDGEDLHMTELGERVRMSRAGVTAMTDNLENLGVMTRERWPGDRRRVLIKISKKAHAQVLDAIS